MEENTISIAMLDDDSGALRIISASVSSLMGEMKIPFEIDTYDEPSALLSSNKDYDLFFCDIEMPDRDGIDVSFEFKKKHKDMEIVFVSNREDKVFDSLKVHPFGFIRKKNFMDDIRFLLRSYFEKMKERKKEPDIIFSFQTSYRKIKLKDIIYIESQRKNQLVHIKDENPPLEVTSTMKELEEKLTPYGFLMTHKAFLVNYRYITDIDNDYMIHLSNGEKVYLAKRKAVEIKERYLELMQKDVELIF